MASWTATVLELSKINKVKLGSIYIKRSIGQVGISVDVSTQLEKVKALPFPTHSVKEKEKASSVQKVKIQCSVGYVAKKFI